MITSKEIKKICDNYFEIDIASKSRFKEYNFSRFIYCKLAYKYTNESHRLIAIPISRHRCSVIHALNNVDGIFPTYPNYKTHYKKLEEIISGTKIRTIEQKREDAFKLAMHYRKKYLECLK